VAKQLGLKSGSDDWHNSMITPPWMPGASPSRHGKRELLARLPAFFRTLSGQKPSREDLENS